MYFITHKHGSREIFSPPVHILSNEKPKCCITNLIRDPWTLPIGKPARGASPPVAGSYATGNTRAIVQAFEIHVKLIEEKRDLFKIQNPAGWGLFRLILGVLFPG